MPSKKLDKMGQCAQRREHTVGRWARGVPPHSRAPEQLRIWLRSRRAARSTPRPTSFAARRPRFHPRPRPAPWLPQWLPFGPLLLFPCRLLAEPRTVAPCPRVLGLCESRRVNKKERNESVDRRQERRWFKWVDMSSSLNIPWLTRTDTAGPLPDRHPSLISSETGNPRARGL